MTDENVNPYPARRAITVPDDVDRTYRVALADYRLRRGHMLPPCIAAVVDAVLVVVDPLGRTDLFRDRDAASAYDDVAGRIWLRLTAALILADHVDHADDTDRADDGSCERYAHEDGSALVVEQGIPAMPFEVLRGIVADELVAAAVRDHMEARPAGDEELVVSEDDLAEFLQIVDREFGTGVDGHHPASTMRDAPGSPAEADEGNRDGIDDGIDDAIDDEIGRRIDGEVFELVETVAAMIHLRLVRSRLFA